MLDNTISENPPVTLSKSEGRPLVRFYARAIDLFIFGAFLFVCVVAFKVYVLFLDSMVFEVFALFMWVFFEAITLGLFGTTFGKWILNVSLKDTNGKKIGFKAAFNRSVQVWLVGQAIGIPFIALAANAFGFFSLTKKGTTFWDKRAGTVVTHKKIGIRRIIGAIFAVLLALTLMILGLAFIPGLDEIPL